MRIWSPHLHEIRPIRDGERDVNSSVYKPSSLLSWWNHIPFSTKVCHFPSWCCHNSWSCNFRAQLQHWLSCKSESVSTEAYLPGYLAWAESQLWCSIAILFNNLAVSPVSFHWIKSLTAAQTEGSCWHWLGGNDLQSTNKTPNGEIKSFQICGFAL